MIDLYKHSVLDLLYLMNRKDLKVVAGVKRVLPQVKKVVELAISAIEKGGQVFLVGAGTSGRLAIIEASEIRPTFGASYFKAIIAGGNKAVTNAVEGAEDNNRAVVEIMRKSRVSSRDLVIGITASGTTPFTRAALNLARSLGSKTALITNKPRRYKCDVLIVAETGKEVIDGSTRLKAGTATKMILNMITTCTMIKLGYTYKDFMIGVSNSSDKLKKRQVAILQKLTGCSGTRARNYLAKSRNDVKLALIMMVKKMTGEEAKAVLKQNKNNINKAMLM